jgi:hypothetical protein
MRSIIRPVLFALLALLAAAASAQDIGRVQFISGPAEAQRGAQKVALAAGSQLREGDVITTGADGHVQLEMVDGARIAMRPRTTLSLERYEFSEASRQSGNALLSLVTGTMRVFTGAIVSRDRSRFQMKTNLATVGIRGSGNILANLDGTETLNHTLTGAHSVTSIDSQGIERTLVSRPGQTVQVLPRQAPRYVPTPPLILSAASQPATARAASEKAADTAATSPAGGGSAAAASTAAAAAESPPASTTAATTTAATTSDAPPAAAASGTTSTTSPTSSTAVTTTSPTVTTSQATTGTVGAAIVVAQPPAASNTYGVVLRFANPIATGFEGVLANSNEGGSAAVFDESGRLVQVSNAAAATFIAGPGGLPPGYTPLDLTGDVAFSGGTHHDAFRSPDSSVIIGRWEGGNVSIGGRTFDLGPRSASYLVATPTPGGVVGSFTGSATYALAAATAPTDAAGRVGSVTSASIVANFTSLTIGGNFGLSINGQALSLSGTSGLAPGASDFAFASALGSLSVTCSGNCATQGYLGTVNGQFAGADARWVAINYRVNPNRAPQNGFPDFIVGSMALQTTTLPTIGVVLPQTGSASLVFTGVDATQSSINYPGATGAPTVTGTVQANFTNRTAAFNATINGGCGCTNPTFTASATNVPLVGAGFSASTDVSRPSNVGAMTVACTGSGCGTTGSAAGRFDGLFRNSAGTIGIASITVGDSGGGYDAVATFGPATSSSMLPVSDARAAARWSAPPESIGAFTAGMARLSVSRTARIQ